MAHQNPLPQAWPGSLSAVPAKTSPTTPGTARPEALAPGAGPSPNLVALLAQLGLIERPATPPSFVEGMGRWLDWRSAIALSAVLQSPLPTPARPADNGARPDAADRMARAFSQVRQGLVRAIQDELAAAGSLTAGSPDDFVPWRRCHSGLQQAMAAAIGPLRAQLRAALAQQSPALAQLAALDAVMAEALAPREQAQLAQMPALLDKHFTRLRQAHADLHLERVSDNDSGRAAPPWLSTFRRDLQRLLLAELALRLQAAQGLLDTLCSKPQAHHELV